MDTGASVFVVILEVDRCGHLRGAKGMVTVYYHFCHRMTMSRIFGFLKRRAIQAIDLSDFLKFGM